MTKDRKPLALLAVLAVSLILVSALVAVNVDARGANANGKKGGGGTTPTSTCSVAPNPAALFSTVTISGSGFSANSVLGFTVSVPGGTFMTFAVSDGSGNVSTTYNTVWTGTNTVKFDAGATCTFLVQ